MNLNAETDRLYIRPLTIVDGDFIIQLVNSKGWIQFIGDRNIHDIQAANDYIQRILSNANYYYNVFEIKDSKKPIGIVTLLHREKQIYPDIGFAMLPEFEKSGYAFEATKHYLDQIKKNFGGKLIAITKHDNVNSINLLKKLGLLFETNYTENDEELDMYSIIINKE